MHFKITYFKHFRIIQVPIKTSKLTMLWILVTLGLNCNSFKFKFQFRCTLHFIPTRFYSICTNTWLYIKTLHGYSLIKIRFQSNGDNTEMHIYLSLLLSAQCNSELERGNASSKQTSDCHCPQRPGIDCLETTSSHKPINKNKSYGHSKPLLIMKFVQ
jgi:hypothetical protein